MFNGHGTAPFMKEHLERVVVLFMDIGTTATSSLRGENNLPEHEFHFPPYFFPYDMNGSDFLSPPNNSGMILAVEL